MEGDPHMDQSPHPPGRYFYPRPHMEGDQPTLTRCYIYAISTHALTWRATRTMSSRISGMPYFYPRPHMEGD